VSTTIEVLEPGAVVPAFTGGALAPTQVKARAEWVREVTKAALTEGTDYGIIPGTEKPTLLKSGAEMLLLAAGLGFTMTKVDDADAREHKGVTYTCTVRRGDFVVSECDGYAGYDESRFFTSAEDAERRERGNAMHYHRAPNPAKYVEYRAPWNTLVKMAQKRALVGATLNATAASGLFIADLEDFEPGGAHEATGGPVDAGDSTTAQRGRRGASSGSSKKRKTPKAPAPARAPQPRLTDREKDLSGAELDEYTEWHESRNYPWPPTSSATIKAAHIELDRIFAARPTPTHDPETGEIPAEAAEAAS
jgi:hypothetical protein